LIDPTLQRKMFQGAMPQADAEGLGITSGLGEVAGQMDAVNKGIDSAESPEGIMNVLRGDNQSVEERRTELASYVGKPDAKQTPESVLTLLQPTFAILDMAETTQAPRTEEASMRIAMGETPVKRKLGSNMFGEFGRDNPYNYKIESETPASPKKDALAGTIAGDKFDIMDKFFERYDLGGGPGYATLLQRYKDAQQPVIQAYQQYAQDANKAYKYNPLLAALNLAGSVASAPRGQLISTVLAPESVKRVTDPLLQMAQGTAQAEAQAKLKAAEAESAAMTAATKDTAAGDTTKATLMGIALKEALGDPAAGSIKTETITRYNEDLGINETFILPVINGIPREDLGVAYEKDRTYQSYQIGNDTFFLSDADIANPNFDFNTAKKLTSVDDLHYVTLDSGKVLGLDKKTGAIKVTHGETKFSSKYEVVNTDGNVLLLDKKIPGRYVQVYNKDQSEIFNFDGVVVRRKKDGTLEGLNGKFGIPEVDDLKKTEFVRNIEAFAQARDTLNTLEPGTDQYKSALTTIQAFREKLLTKPELGEFERIQKAQGDRIFDQTLALYGGSPRGAEEAQKAREKFLGESSLAYLTAKTSGQSNYDPKAAMNKAGSDNIFKVLNEKRASADIYSSLAFTSSQAEMLSNSFKTGAFGELRLNLANVLESSGLDGVVKKTLEKFNIDTEGKSLSQILGGNVAAGQNLDALGKQIAIDLAQNFPGNLNREEVQIISSVGPSLFKTNESIKLITEIFQAASLRENKILDGANELVRSEIAKGTDPAVIDTKLDDFLRTEKAKLQELDLTAFKERADALIAQNEDLSSTMYVQELRNADGEIAVVKRSELPLVNYLNSAEINSEQDLINAFRTGKLNTVMQEADPRITQYQFTDNQNNNEKVERFLRAVYEKAVGHTMLVD